MNPLDSQIRSALGAIITIGFFGVFIAFMLIPLPDTVRDIVLVLLGALIASFKEVTGYFFGSSAGSAAKDETIRAQMRVAATGAATQVPQTVRIDDAEPVKVQEAQPVAAPKAMASMRYAEHFDEAAPSNHAPVKEQPA